MGISSKQSAKKIRDHILRARVARRREKHQREQGRHEARSGKVRHSEHWKHYAVIAHRRIGENSALARAFRW
jgi:hypothetical protein